MSKKSHEARGSAMGYLFQCRYALLLGLQAIPTRPQLAISLEKFDDVAFENDGAAVELIQTKHHVAKTGSLSDSSTDLWKTLSNWAQLVTADAEVPFKQAFFLLTTSVAPVDSAAALLGTQDRNEAAARTLLLNAAGKSKNAANAPFYDAFTVLPEPHQLALLRAITVLDGSPNIVDVHEDICVELRHAVSRDHLTTFVERLEGWWFGVVISALNENVAIPVLAIDDRIDELREEFQRRALPVDFAGHSPSSTVVAELDKRPFVRQLKWIDVGGRRIEFAIRDYYRASEQRSRWAREQLLVNGEIEKYELELIEAWEPRFEAMVDGIPTPSADTEKRAVGRQLFTWAETEALFPIRTVQHRFLTHGTYHILANRRAVGWHPDYKALASAEVSNDDEEGSDA